MRRASSVVLSMLLVASPAIGAASTTTPSALKHTRQCGYRHVGWTPAGFLGDELPSDTHPNDMLLRKALRDIKDGDILLLHLGIRSRKEPPAPILDPLIAALKQRGLCFATLAEASK